MARKKNPPSILDNFRTPTASAHEPPSTPEPPEPAQAPEPEPPPEPEPATTPPPPSPRRTRALEMLVEIIDGIEGVPRPAPKPATALAACELLLESADATPVQREAALRYLDRVLDDRVLVESRERILALGLVLKHG